MCVCVSDKSGFEIYIKDIKQTLTDSLSLPLCVSWSMCLYILVGFMRQLVYSSAEWIIWSVYMCVCVLAEERRELFLSVWEQRVFVCSWRKRIGKLTYARPHTHTHTCYFRPLNAWRFGWCGIWVIQLKKFEFQSFESTSKHDSILLSNSITNSKHNIRFHSSIYIYTHIHFGKCLMSFYLVTLVNIQYIS